MSDSGGDGEAERPRRRTEQTLKQRLQKLLRLYNDYLRRKPVLTKSVTNAILSGLGNLAAQRITGSDIKWRSMAAFSIFGLAFSGPLFHYFYRLLNDTFPPKSQHAVIKKVLVDRLVFSPPFFLLFFYIIALLEGRGLSASWQSAKKLLWPALKMSWKVWTVVQVINLKYVPEQYQLLFTSLVSFFWTAYLALLQR